MNTTILKRWLLPTLVMALVLVSLLVPAPAGEQNDAQLPSNDVVLWTQEQCLRTNLRDRGECGWLLREVTPQTFTEVDQTGYVKGIYVSHGALFSAFLLDHVRSLLETTELNAVVIDVKGDAGYLSYPSSVGLVGEIGADQKTAMDHETWAQFMDWFQVRGISTIARVVTFKDELLAVAHPEWAVTDSETGGVWRDKKGIAWTNPSQEQVQVYNVALAVEAARLGFEEVQFDYVRFPSDGDLSRARSLPENTRENRVAAIAGFLEKASQALRPLGARVSADVFGYASWLDHDLGIGHYIEALAPHLDVVSPMLYPSSFDVGLPGLDPAYQDAIAYPYEIVQAPTQRTLERARVVNPHIEVRPWIQDFPDYGFDGRTYTPTEIRQQMEGAREGGARGWMLWDPAVKYTPEALVSAQPLHAPNPFGGVLVLAYQSIGYPEDILRRTPENFRADLERLLAEGYYPVNLRDLAEGELRMVPAGKRPVVLTFDDSTLSQFRLEPDGTIHGDSAVGILRAFNGAHPADWPLRGTFFVRAGAGNPVEAPFGQQDQAALKLATLVYWGMEVGSYIPRQVKLGEMSGEEVQRELSRNTAQLEAWLPGYSVVSLAVADGSYPRDESLLAAGEHGGAVYRYEAAVRAATGLAPSPRSPYFRSYHIPRVRATQPEAEYWLEFANQPGAHYVSSGE